MSIIRILQEQVANKIAAGEVIARPASAVKELGENSLDAGAAGIKITIEQAGLKLITVTDNGLGMDGDDALLCLEAHATSKISCLEDIYNLATLGFRGEALASIAAVSRFTLRTRPAAALAGTEVLVQGGKFIHSKPVGCAPGTEAAVCDLFFNTPARRKFLKSASTEEKHIIETVYALALPFPAVAFELVCDNKIVLNSPAHHDLRPRLDAFFGAGFNQRLLPVNHKEHDITVTGFIAKHGFTKNSRKEQRIFVNGRAAEAQSAFAGIRDGYGTLVARGRFPPLIIFLRMDPALVDVNVHPAKKEVKFRNERLVAQVITNAIRNTLKTAASPGLALPVEISISNLLQGAEVAYNLNPDGDHSTGDATRGVIAASTLFSAAPPDDKQTITDAETRPASSILPPSFESADLRFPGSGPVEILGCLGEVYLLAKARTGLIIIDQHAAHERVLYERLLKSAATTIAAQKLLLPITIELNSAERICIEKNLPIFNRLGFEIEPFGQNTVLIHSVPAVFPPDNIGGLLSDLLAELTDQDQLAPKIDLNALAQAACKTAVKAHDRLTNLEIKALLKQLSECELPFSCPHGRPTIINISIKELEKRFGRQ